MIHRILLLDQFNAKGMAILRENPDIELVQRDRVSEAELCQIISPFHVLITRSQNAITKEILSAAKELRIVGRGGVGVDNIDIDQATQQGIMVINTPDANIISAAEHTIALLTSLVRKVPLADRSIRRGEWKREQFIGRELNAKTIGIIGLGRVGSRVARVCHSLQMKVIAFDPYIADGRFKMAKSEKVALPDLLRQSDYITVHTPLTSETQGMIAATEISQMKDPVFLVNCARGGIFKEEDLEEALKSGRIAGAAIDVYENEPVSAHPFYALDNVVLTPHIGANTYEAQERVAVQLVQSIIQALQGQPIAGAINLPFTLDDGMDFLRSHMKVAEKMGTFLAQYSETQRPVERVTLTAFGEIADHAAIFITCFLKGLCHHFLGERVNYVNVLALAKERQIETTSLVSKEPTDYKNLIQATIFREGEEHTVSATVFGFDHPRIVAIDDYHIEVKPFGTKLVVKNEDVPGVIGQVGTLLGKSHINIAEYFLSKPDDSNLALAIISLDNAIDANTLKKLKALAPIRFAQVIEF